VIASFETSQSPSERKDRVECVYSVLDRDALAPLGKGFTLETGSSQSIMRQGPSHRRLELVISLTNDGISGPNHLGLEIGAPWMDVAISISSEARVLKFRNRDLPVGSHAWCFIDGNRVLLLFKQVCCLQGLLPNIPCNCQN